MPNIEFRVDVNDYKFNYHVIFSDKIPPEKIDREFIQSLRILDYNGDKIGLNTENIVEIGGICKRI